MTYAINLAQSQITNLGTTISTKQAQVSALQTQLTNQMAQADAAIHVTRDLLTPAMSFVDDRPQLVDRQRGLRDQLAILTHP